MLKKVFLKKGIYYDIVNDKYIFETGKQNHSVNQLPLSFGLQITRNCNLKCIHCSDFERMNEVSLSQIKNILDIIKENGLKRVTILDWISKNKKIPRAVYLRCLIEKDMERSKEYSS